jgi:glutathione synthase/RimK-type ligase-like ATP-grasp enzyme
VLKIKDASSLTAEETRRASYNIQLIEQWRGEVNYPNIDYELLAGDDIETMARVVKEIAKASAIQKHLGEHIMILNHKMDLIISRKNTGETDNVIDFNRNILREHKDVYIEIASGKQNSGNQ